MAEFRKIVGVFKTFWSLRTVLLPCLFYFSFSFALNVLNKAILTGYGWSLYSTLQFSQNVIMLLGLIMMGTAKKSLLSWDLIKRVLPLTIIDLCNVLSGFVALANMSLPMYLMVRRTVTLIVLVFEIYYLNKVVKNQAKIAIVLIISGSIIAGFADISFSFLGYLFVILQNIMTAAKYVYMNKVGTDLKQFNLTSLDMMFVNVCLTLPMSFILTSVRGEFTKIAEFENLRNVGFIICFSVICLCGVGYALSVYICTTRNSALATTVTGNVKDLFSTLFGFMFGDAAVSVQNGFGLFVSFVGAYWYAYLKFKDAHETRKEEKDVHENENESSGKDDKEE
eukprot:TRINITY_DN776208_c0_g1_i1.p1 TRINITY_DN776208_c0_g1~~TRINITY_DN776208_c0_g1_i1.p1  ORF type:complete len:338 (-),score=89.42 TRINITY_DN776208_c0_g1_i1:163-1176(-)